MVLILFTTSCNCHHIMTKLSISKYFHSSNRNWPLRANSSFCLHPRPGNLHSTHCLMNLTILGTSCEWTHVLFVPVCLVYFTWHNVLKIHPCWSRCQSFIHFYSWVIFHNMTTPHFVDPFIPWWILVVLLPFFYCKYWYEHWHTSIICSSPCFLIPWMCMCTSEKHLPFKPYLPGLSVDGCAFSG